MDRQTDKSGYNMYRGWTQAGCQKWLEYVEWMDRVSDKSGYNIYR